MDRGKTTGTLCRICNKPVGLTFDTAVDQDGKAVHELCYVREVTNQNGSNWQSLYNNAVAELDPHNPAAGETCASHRLTMLKRRHPNAATRFVR